MSHDLYQAIRITCESSWTSRRDVDGHRLRDWKVTLVAMNNDKQVPGKLQAMLDHVEYVLHPTFLEPNREIKEEPYTLTESGWGEFVLKVNLYFKDNFAPMKHIVFDLNFRKPQYSEMHCVKLHNVSPRWKEYLDSLGTKKPRMDDVVAKSDITDPIYSLPLNENTCLEWNIPMGFNMVELARRMDMLSESQVADLYILIQTYQTDDMTIKEKNDQLTMDLYSLGTPLLNRLWEFTETIFGYDTE